MRFFLIVLSFLILCCCGLVRGGDRSICSLPKLVGPCRKFQPSFFYNTETAQCERFIYGGCRGNDNRFHQKEDCEAECL